MKSTVEEGYSYTTLTTYTIEGHRLCVPDIVGWKHFLPTNYDNSTENRSSKKKNQRIRKTNRPLVERLC